MLAKPEDPRFPLTKGWLGCIMSSLLHTVVDEKAYAAFVKNRRFKQTIDLFDKPALQ